MKKIELEVLINSIDETLEKALESFDYFFLALEFYEASEEKKSLKCFLKSLNSLKKVIDKLEIISGNLKELIKEKGQKE